ncbi:hypothetical protein ScPMuIL_000362 [Solemya velum]
MTIENPSALSMRRLPNFDFDPPVDCGVDGDDRCRDLFMEFVYCVMIPAAVVIGITFVLCVLMFCSGSQSKKQKTSPEDETQLMHYNSIRRASHTLRQLSQHRDTPLMSSRSSLTLDRDHRLRRGMRGRDTCHSAPGTLQRDRDRHRNRERMSWNNPPGYRYPPDYLGASNVPSPEHAPLQPAGVGADGYEYPNDQDCLVPPQTGSLGRNNLYVMN